MLYYLFTYLHKTFNIPGFGVFRYITFRAGAAAVTALIIAFWLGPIIIRKLRAKGYDFVTLDEMVALGYKVR